MITPRVRSWVQAGTFVALLAAGLPPLSALHAQVADSAIARLDGLVAAGDRAGARALADSLVGALPDQSPQFAEALYWRGFAASQAADAERDYFRLSVEFPFSPRAPDALLALAQLEYARGDHAAARRRFDRLLREYPAGPHVARASYWSGRLALDQGDLAAACQSLSAARRTVSAGEVELANQIEYYVAQCLAALRDTGTGASPPAGGAPPPRPPPTSRAAEYSIQVAAFSVRADATALASRLRERGFSVRVAGTRAPFRVRIGRYASRELAAAALERMRESRVTGIIVEAEPPP